MFFGEARCAKGARDFGLGDVASSEQAICGLADGLFFTRLCGAADERYDGGEHEGTERPLQDEHGNTSLGRASARGCASLEIRSSIRQPRRVDATNGAAGVPAATNDDSPLFLRARSGAPTVPRIKATIVRVIEPIALMSRSDERE